MTSRCRVKAVYSNYQKMLTFLLFAIEWRGFLHWIPRQKLPLEGSLRFALSRLDSEKTLLSFNIESAYAGFVFDYIFKTNSDRAIGLTAIHSSLNFQQKVKCMSFSMTSRFRDISVFSIYKNANFFVFHCRMMRLGAFGCASNSTLNVFFSLKAAT